MCTLTFVCNKLSSCDLVSNDSFEGEPEEKRRKTTNVVIDQPATEHKVLIDNVPDQSSLLDEVIFYFFNCFSYKCVKNTHSIQ